MHRSRSAVVPPRRSRVTCQFIPQQLWRALPVEQRERILGALIRAVSQQLAKPPKVEEVTHERS